MYYYFDSIHGFYVRHYNKNNLRDKWLDHTYTYFFIEKFLAAIRKLISEDKNNDKLWFKKRWIEQGVRFDIIIEEYAQWKAFGTSYIESTKLSVNDDEYWSNINEISIAKSIKAQT